MGLIPKMVCVTKPYMLKNFRSKMTLGGGGRVGGDAANINMTYCYQIDRKPKTKPLWRKGESSKNMMMMAFLFKH